MLNIISKVQEPLTPAVKYPQVSFNSAFNSFHWPNPFNASIIDKVSLSLGDLKIKDITSECVPAATIHWIYHMKRSWIYPPLALQYHMSQPSLI